MTLDDDRYVLEPPRGGGDVQPMDAATNVASVDSSGPRRRIAPAPIRFAIRALVVLGLFVILHAAATLMWAAAVLAIVFVFITRTLTSRR